MLSSDQRRLRGRIGGLRRAAMHDGREMTAAARHAYGSSFLTGHGPCGACGPSVVTIPADLPAIERERRARKLRAAHFASLAFRSAKARTKNAVPADNAGTATRSEGHGNGTPIAA